MKRTHLIVLALFALTISSLRGGDANQTDYPFGAFNQDFARLGADEASQIRELQSIGYSGFVMNASKRKTHEELKRYQAAIGDGPFKLYAASIVVDFGADLAAQNAHIDKVVQSLKKSDAKLWVILRARGGKKIEREQIVAFLRSAAERTKAAGVELIIYPHWSGANPLNVCLIQTAEEALTYVEEVGSDNLFISLQLGHEIKAGNGDRLNEVAAKIKPWLRLSTIHGADIDAVNETEGWDRGIQPLTEGDYDSSKLLKALKSVGYKGPVLLHTFGMNKAAADHHQTSFKRFQEMVAELDEE